MARKEVGARGGRGRGAAPPHSDSCAENATNNSRAVKKSKGSAKRPEGSKMVFTRDNINSHLLGYNSNPKEYKVLGLLTYLFKEFKDEPADLLAKLKILTMNRKEKVEGERVEKMVLRHLFLVFDLKGDFFDNLFGILKNGSFLAVLASDLYFAAPFEDGDDFTEHFNRVYEELRAIWEPRAALDCAGFMEEIDRLAQAEDLEELAHGAAECEDAKESSEDGSGEAQNVSAKDAAVLEGSDCSLLSLTDDDRIAQLDLELGKIFHRGDVSEEAGAYSSLLLGCMEKMVGHNYVSDLQVLNRLFYLHQFDQLSGQTKAVVKVLVSKFGDRRAVFQMYQRAALVLQQTYGLHSMLRQHCGESFDELSLIRVSIGFGQEGFIVNKIESGVFYSFYAANRDKRYLPFLLALLRKEKDADLLRPLLAGENTAEVETAIKAAIGRAERRIEHPRRKKAVQKSGERRQQEKEAPCDIAAAGTEASGDSLGERAEVAAKSRSFADKVGIKIADRKKELKKKYRWENLKAKKKSLRHAKGQDTEEERVRITKKRLRSEEQAGTPKRAKKAAETGRDAAHKKSPRSRGNK